MDDDRENKFLLDTSIVVPIAIAGAVAVLIVAFVYCCRQFAYSNRLLRQPRQHTTTAERNRTGTSHGQERGPAVHQHRHGGNLSNVISAAMMGYLPSSRNQYPPSSHQSRANYNSTQTTQPHYPQSHHEQVSGPTPSAPPMVIGEAPPPYSLAMKYPRANERSTARGTSGHNSAATAADVTAPPPPYSPHNNIPH